MAANKEQHKKYQYSEKGKKAYKEARKRYYDSIKGKASKLKYFYGMTVEEYRKLEIEQNNRCAICKDVKQLCVDHEHTTGRIRGLLCRNCNTAVGMIYDNPQIALNIIEYLKGE